MTIEAKLDKLIELTELLVASAGGNTPAAPKTRGRPAKGEVNGEAVKPAVEPAAATAVDASPATAPAAETPKQIGTKEAMKAAVLAYRDATSQDIALKLLTDVGAENFGAVNPALYQQV